MASQAHAQAVKSLNKDSGRRRFVFKSFSQRLEEIDINVFRSLDKIKAEPSEGSSFLRDCLVEWRELNTAEDFISFYEEMLPYVQTLPLVLLHRESIFSNLICRLQMTARLSLEPILRLIAALSRDLLDDFIPFLPRLSNSLVALLENGGDKDPETIEQIFTSLSYIMMYLQKYFVKDIIGLLKVTLKLRYYPKDYVADCMAEAASFLLRNAPDEQLEKGICKIVFEAAKKPFATRKYGAAALLYYSMRGSSTGLHSRAERVLRLLVGRSLFSACDNLGQGPDTVVEVVSTALQRLCVDLDTKKLNLMWKCLYVELNDSATNKTLSHLSQLLSILNSVIQIEKGRRVSDYQPVIDNIGLLVSSYIASSRTVEAEDGLSEIVDKILQLMLSILDGLHSFNDIEKIRSCSQEWAPVFVLKKKSLLSFIQELLKRDQLITELFVTNILSAINNLIYSSEEAIYLLLLLCNKHQTNYHGSYFFGGTSEGKYQKVSEFLEESLKRAVQELSDGYFSSSGVSEAKLAVLWGVICCYPHFQVNSGLLMDLLCRIKDFLKTTDENIVGISRDTWQSLLGAALSSYYKFHYVRRTGRGETSEILSLCKAHKSSLQVLSAAADYLDYVHGPALLLDTSSKTYHPELKAEKAVEAFGLFSKNLRHQNKDVRLTTLRILCHYEPLRFDASFQLQPHEKRLKTEDSRSCVASSNVLQHLLVIEETPLSVSTSRKVVLLISKIQMDLSAGRICKEYVPLVLSAIIGIFHNRFSYVWNPASECLAIAMKKHAGVLWDDVVHYWRQCQCVFLAPDDQITGVNANTSEDNTDLVKQFSSYLNPLVESTPSSKVLSLLLQTLQKIPSVAEPRSQQVMPLFMEFLGYSSENLTNVGSFRRDVCKGKEWKGVLKEWLMLLKSMRNPKSLHLSQFVKAVLQNRLLDDNDPEIQMKVLECLLLWKDDFLVPYEQHLKNLISSKDLREELTIWSLSKETNHIEDTHRSHLVPVVIRLLMPKVRKLKALASRKHTSVHHRKAVLNFIAQLDVDEVPLLFVLLIKPLNIASEDNVDFFWVLPSYSMDEFRALNLLKYFTTEAISLLSWKKRSGFLHVIQHIIGVFDDVHITPFLDLLMGCVVRILLSCTMNLDAAKDTRYGQDYLLSTDLTMHGESNVIVNHVPTTVVRQFKELRSLCLKIISLVLDKHEEHVFAADFWDLFFTSIKPLIESFKQEGSSSEKPSSLFSCFLAMSRNHNLVTLLCREKTLVPDIFSILTVVTASEAVKYSVLKFIENLLNLDNELDGEQNVVKALLVPNMETLIYSLHCLSQSDYSAKRKSVKYHGEREIRILKPLSRYIREPVQARKYLDILLSFLSKSVKDSGVRVEALEAIRDIIPAVGLEHNAKILNTISPLLLTAELDMRLCICDLLEALAETDSSLIYLAKLLRDLNATSVMEIDGLEYDIIADTYAKFDSNFFARVSEEHALIILSQCVYNMSSEELTLRHGAYCCLHSFIGFSALILGKQVSEFNKLPQENLIAEGNIWTKTSVLNILRDFLLKHISDEMNQGGPIKKEWVDLLRQMILKLPDPANLSPFRALCSEDAEVDFFSNIIHIQKHRKARALARFGNLIGRDELPEGIVKSVFVPLFFKMMLDGQEGKDDNVRSACIDALASTSACLQWKSYYALLMRCFREMKVHVNKQKILVRLICSLLDKFHFMACRSDEEAEDNSNDRIDGQACAQIRSCLQKTVFPKIQKVMESDRQNVNVKINLAALKLLKLLPGDIMDSQLPTIVHRLSNFQKNRLESIRDEARLALAACLKELGLEYLQFLVKVLRAILRRGYELHVLGYTVHFLLSKCLPNPVIGKLDYCLEDLLSVVENDILGEVAEQKEVEKIASKMKETRRCKSFESMKLIAQNVTFKTHCLKLLSPVTTNLQSHLTPKVKAKLASMLDHIAAGIECNPSVHQTDLFIFVYGLIKDGIDAENGSGEQTSKVNSHKSKGVDGKKENMTSGPHVGTKSGSHLITVFGLGVLHNQIKKMKLDKNNEQQLSMLDPFVKLLGECLSSKYEDILSSSLKCLTPLIRLPLPSLGYQAEKVKSILLSIAQSTVNSSSPLVESCLRLLTVLLRSTEITLSSDQLHLLVSFPMFVDLERTPSFVALSLLKAIVSKKLVVPEIYDIAVRVGELMVVSQLEPIRKKCSQILLQFLLAYDLSEKRLQQHLDFLLGNLRYEHSSGREAVLEMLHAIIVKFPKDKINAQSQTLFVHLVVCLANDHDSKVRSMAGAIIKLLIGHIGPHSLNSILEYALSWYLGGKQQLWAASAQVLGLLIEVMKKRFRKHINSVLVVMRSILRSASSCATHEQQNLSEESSIPFWREAYYSLVMLEKMLYQFHDLALNKDLEEIWESICELLLHPHTWLCHISCRLLGLYFGAVAGARRENSRSLEFHLMKPSRLFMVAVSICFQLKTQIAHDDAHISLLTANLVFAISSLHSLMEQTDSADAVSCWSTLEQYEQAQFLKAFQMLDSRKGKSMFLAFTSGVHEGGSKENVEDPSSFLVSNLLKRMGKLALEMDSFQMKIAFNVFRSFSLQISQEERQRYAFLMLLPLYKVCEGFVGKVISDEMKQLAQEVCGSLRDALGMQTFVQVYSEIRKSMKAKRDKRRQEQKVMAVVNPMRSAKRKRKMAEKHRTHKKRKMMTMRMARWMR